MAGKVQQLSDFIVTKANDLGLSITQVVNVDDATIIAAIPVRAPAALQPMMMLRER